MNIYNLVRIIVVAAICSASLTFFSLSNQLTPTTFLILLFTLSPYLILLLVGSVIDVYQKSKVWMIFSVLVSIYGIGAFIQLKYFITDAQGPLMFLAVPIHQWIGIGVVFTILRIMRFKY